MSKRFNIPFNTLVWLALTIGIVHFASSLCFSADAYPIPQTAEVTLAWDPNDPAPDGYRIYQREEGQAYTYSQPCWTGPGTSGTVYNLDRDTTYFFVVRAYVGALESADSEEVSFVSPSSELATYVVTATAGENGSISPGGTVEVVEASDQTFIITPEVGHHVADVKVDEVSKGAIAAYTFSQVNANHTIEASFAPDTHIISATASANGNINPVGSTNVAHGADQTFIISPDAGCRVANVMVDGVAKGALLSYTFEGVTDSHTIIASFVVDTHQINATAGTDGSISPEGTLSVGHLASQRFTINPSTGHHVADVVVDGASIGAVNSYIFDQIVADHNIHATFAADTVAITATAGANGAIAPDGVVNVTYGGSQTYTFSANNGFCISDVQVDGQSMGAIGSYTFSNVTNPHTISVGFSEIQVANIRIEAEDGNLFWPMEIGDDPTAAAGGYIWVPTGSGNILTLPGDTGYAEYHFEVPKTGDYVIWGRQISNDTGSDSFFVSVDGQSEMVWHTKLGGQDVWTWDVVSERTAGEPRQTTNPKTYWMEAGSHTLSIIQREDGTKLDSIFVTNDARLSVSDIEAAFQAPVIAVDTYDRCISGMDTASIGLDANDPGNGNLTYAWELPDGGSISGSGNRVEFIPDPIGPHACPYQVTVVVTSEATLLSASATFDIYVGLSGDINGDGVVNLADLARLRADFGKVGVLGGVPADLNTDGSVNLLDFAIMRSQYGQNGCACQ
ncbi:dockerin type I domain-containing protein [Desulfosarcina sp.]|uniref:dockerin type I domain-containing protein n=1 Tax=Desulfosarcina sp. TaxID=2027861 RepID=UPI0035699ABF